MRVLIDTGSSYSFIRSSVLGSLRHSPVRLQTVNLTLADGSTPFSVIGEVSLHLRVKYLHTPVHCFVVKDLCCDCLLGTDWINYNLVTLDFHHQRLTIRYGDRHASVRLETDVENISFPVRLLRNTAIPIVDPPAPTVDSPPINLPNLNALSVSPLDPDRIRAEQQSDAAIQHLIAQLDQFYLFQDGILFRRSKKYSLVPVLPSSLIREVLHAFHDHISAAHFGRNRTYSKIAKRCFWPNMHRDIQTYVRSCDLCTRHNIPRQKLPGHLQSISPPRGVFDLVGLDFWGPTKEPSTNLNRYVLVLTDYMPKFIVARATPLNNAQTVAEFLLETASTFGVPHQLLTDQGSHFNNELINRMSLLMGRKHTLSTAYHPQTNGQVERWNATMRAQLNKLAVQQPTDWDTFLPAIVSAHNSGEHATTGIAPFEMMFGRTSTTVFDPAQPLLQLSRPSDYLAHLRTYRTILVDTARHNTREQQQRMQARYDHNRSDPRYSLADLVFVRTPPPLRANGAALYQGPYRVVQLVDTQTYVVEQVHSNMLKPIFSRD